VRTPLIVVIVAATTAALAIAQPERPPQPKGTPTPEMMAEMMKAMSAPSAEHRLLEAFLGEFTYRATMYMPGAEPMTSSGVSSAKWILGNRFIKQESASDPKEPIPFEGLSIYGFDTRTRKFTLVAFDTLGTYSVSAEGDYDAASRTITLLGENQEDGKTMKFKWVNTFRDDGHTQTILFNFTGEEWTRIAEVVFTKK
jgi:hypothetical protein